MWRERTNRAGELLVIDGTPRSGLNGKPIRNTIRDNHILRVRRRARITYFDRVHERFIQMDIIRRDCLRNREICIRRQRTENARLDRAAVTAGIRINFLSKVLHTCGVLYEDSIPRDRAEVLPIRADRHEECSCTTAWNTSNITGHCSTCVRTSRSRDECRLRREKIGDADAARSIGTSIEDIDLVGERIAKVHIRIRSCLRKAEIRVECRTIDRRRGEGRCGVIDQVTIWLERRNRCSIHERRIAGSALQNIEPKRIGSWLVLWEIWKVCAIDRAVWRSHRWVWIKDASGGGGTWLKDEEW